jgi:hypothetical protein
MMFGFGYLPGTPPPPGPGGGRGFGPTPAGSDPPATEQLIADGWGYAILNPVSVQADNGAGLTRGFIGLVNRGQPRKPDDWGSLRAWAWGASRGLDYLETDKSVDAKRVGIEGVSRYGKAALVTMAFDTRFAVVLVGSSGEGGAKLHRRNWGEAVENLKGKAPEAIIILMGIFPRNDNVAVLPIINRINDNLSHLADGKKVRYLNINDRLADADGRLFDGMMNSDKLHPGVKAYQVWADALQPIFYELLGSPGKEDHAPPPTGDPSARMRKEEYR